MDNDCFDKTQILPLILIIIILVIILCGRLLVISSGPAPAPGQSRRSWRNELGTAEEEEPLLSTVEAQDASPGQDGRLQGVGNTLTRLSAEIDRWKDAGAKKTEEIAFAQERITTLQQELSVSVSHNAELQQRYETLERDLEGARLFLNTADTFSDSEVIQLLQKLNAELQQTSTFMADRVASAFELCAAMSDPEQQIMLDRAAESIGSTFVRFLRAAKADNPEVPMYLQIAFQAHLAYHVRWIASSWTVDGGRSAFMNEIYQRLRETEKQAISGRWRTLTRLYTIPTCVDEPNSIVLPIIAGLSDVLLAVGCGAPASDVIPKLSSMFDEKILAAISLAGRLNEMIGGVVSGDFEVFSPRPGDTYHEETMMEDVDDDGSDTHRVPGGTATRRIVLCTTELGLTKRIQQGGERETTTVIKAKVIFESFLQD